MQEIVEAYLSVQEPSTALTVCAKNGLPWKDGMWAVVHRVQTNDIERQDDETGLYQFMLAGVRQDEDNYDLASVFHLIKRSPLLVRKYDENDERECQSSRKRKRC